MGDVKKRQDVNVVPKSWGHEEWIVNNDMYCGKRLVFDFSMARTSLHYHTNKHETMYVEAGSFVIVTVDEAGISHNNTMTEGDSIVIPPNLRHRIISLEPSSVLIEFSTHHEDSDSYRISL